MKFLLDLIRKFEGLRLRAYLCPAGVPTIGFGATGKDVRLGTVWTEQDASTRLQIDATLFYAGALKLCPTNLEKRAAALADFAYNVGLTRLAGSTLRRRVNRGDITGAERELKKWVHGGGRVLPGLVKRREAEALLLRG